MDSLTNHLSWQTFAQVDMRVGTIVSAMPSPKARKPAYILTIDFGSLGILKSSAQITDLYDVDALVDTQVVAVINFPPKQVATVMSQCLVLGSVAADGVVTLLRPDRPVANGERIS